MAFQTRLLLPLVLVLPMTCLAQMTVGRARTMPLHELVGELLGESGKIMIDADRPRFPAVLERVKFYSHATVPGSQFGLCAADWVTVDFDEHGRVDTLRAERRYGLAGNIHPPSSEWTYDEFGEMCASVTSTRGYFPAPDPQSALDIAWYVEAIAGKGPFPGQIFEFNCTGLCAKERQDLEWLRLELIDSARLIDCPPSNLEHPSCFELTVGEDEVGPFPKTFRIFGSGSLKRVVITRVDLDVGSTLK